MTTEQTGSVHLGLLLHNHQPVGNFPWVFQLVYEESYLPMIEALERHPSVRLSLHYTGSLLDWIEEAHPEFLAAHSRPCPAANKWTSSAGDTMSRYYPLFLMAIKSGRYAV